MQNKKSIVNIPLFGGIALSIAVHVSAFYGKGLHTPPTPIIETGRTVVQLTLLPTLASQPPPPPLAEPIEKPSEPREEQEQAPLPSAPKEPPENREPLPRQTPEQDGSLQEEKGVAADAQPAQTFHPAYPRISRRRGEEGTVILSIDVLADGRVGNASLIQSSGHKRLDAAALDAAKKTTFIPAKRLGRAVDATTELTFTFRLTHD